MNAAALALAVGLSLLPACAAERGHERAVSEPRAAPSAKPAAPPSAAASASQAPRERPPPAPQPELAPKATVVDLEQSGGEEYSRDEYYPESALLDVDRWLVDHAVRRKLSEQRCWDAADRVGVPPQPGLFCERRSARPTKVVYRLYRLEAGTLSVVWEGVVGTWTNWLELTPLLAVAGDRLTVHDREPGACARALEEFSAKEDAGIPANFGSVLRAGCAGRGEYAWDGDRYVRARPRAPGR